MNIYGSMDREKAFLKALSQYKATCTELFALIRDEEKAKIRRWEHERPSLELLISSLNQSCDILKKDKKRLAAELSAKQAASVSNAGAQASRQGDKLSQQDHSSHYSGIDSALLQRELNELDSRVLATDIEIRNANQDLATCERDDEREYLSTKCVVLQDTRRILAEEMQSIRAQLARMDASSRVEAERRRAEESGWAEVARLEEQLERTIARLDKVKQQMYFPEVKGYRFSSGNGGIYVAARDLHVSEVSGRFEFTCEPILRRAAVAAATNSGVAASASAAAAHGNRVARLTVVLGGVSSSTALADWSELRRGSGGDSSNRNGTSVGGVGSGSRLSHMSSNVSSHSVQSSPGPVAEGDATRSDKERDPSALALPGSGRQPLPLQQQQQQYRHIESQASRSDGGSAPGTLPSPATPTFERGTISSVSSGTINPQTQVSEPLSAQASIQPLSMSPRPEPQQPPQPIMQQQTTRQQSMPAGLPLPLQQQFLRQQQQFQQQQMHTAPPSVSSGPLPGSVPLPYSGAAGSMHTGSNSQGSGMLGSGGGGAWVSAPPPRARSKGEGVANFLSGLKNKKEKLKNMVGGLVGDRDRLDGQQGAGAIGVGLGLGVAAVSGAELQEPYYSGNSASGGRLRTHMMEKLQGGLSDGRGKLSRIGKAITTKAPEALRDIKTKLRPPGRPGSAGGAADAEWEADIGRAVGATAQCRNHQQLQPHLSDGCLLEDNPGLLLLPDMDPSYLGTRAAAVGSGATVGGIGGGGKGSNVHLSPRPSIGQLTQVGSGRRESLEALDGESVLSTAASAPAANSGPEGAAAAAFAPPGDDSLGGFVEDFACRPSRKGVYLQLLGERVELLGEKGTKIPDTSIREIMLEVEVAVTAVFEYHHAASAVGSGSTGGGNSGGGAWLAPEPVSFNILQLDHRMRGNTLPLPRTLIKGLLNAYMPGLLTRLLSGLLPAELGAYTAASGETQVLSGEFKVAGPSLSTTITSIAPPTKPPSDPARRTQWLAVQAAASRARAMLGLSEAQAAAVSELFGGCGRPSLLPEGAGFTPSISGLCRFYVMYIQSKLWTPLVGLLNRALQSAFDFHGVKSAERFQLLPFLDSHVVRLVRKPLRIAFAIERLSLAVDCDAALTTLRDFFERMAREFEAKGAGRASGGGAGDGSGGGGSGPCREPLEIQLELLDLWHASLARLLRAFKQRFRTAGATLLASADRSVFQFGAESVSYDGPLKLKVPLDLAMDTDGSFVVDVKLPDREEATRSITSLLTEVMYSLSTTHNNSTNDNGAVAAGADVRSDGAASTPRGPTHGAAADAAGAIATDGSKSLSSGDVVRTEELNTAFAIYQQEQQQQRQLREHPVSSSRNDPPPLTAVSPPSQMSAVEGVRACATAVQGVLCSNAGSPAASASGLGQAQQQPSSPVAPMSSGSALFDIGQEWAAALAEGMPEGSAVVSGAAPLLQNPVVGQLCVKKLALSLRLDEERVAELLSMTSGATGGGGGARNAPPPVVLETAISTPAHNVLCSPNVATQPGATQPGAAADIAGRLLGCYGDLFTASMDMGWRAQSDADGAAQRPCCMMTVQSNEITRLRAEVEGLWFQSTVSPRLAVRVLQAVVIALVLKFNSADSYSIRFWNRAFNQLHEYLSRGSLDLAVCLSVRAAMDRPSGRLRVELSGQDLNAAGAGGVNGGGQGLLGGVCPVYLLNDVNLMTVFDSVKLLTETAPSSQQTQQPQAQQGH